jgi:hypothetical protein
MKIRHIWTYAIATGIDVTRPLTSSRSWGLCHILKDWQATRNILNTFSGENEIRLPVGQECSHCGDKCYPPECDAIQSCRRYHRFGKTYRLHPQDIRHNNQAMNNKYITNRNFRTLNMEGVRYTETSVNIYGSYIRYLRKWISGRTQLSRHAEETLRERSITFLHDISLVRTETHVTLAS